MEELTIFDPDRNIQVSLSLPLDVANRARNDLDFAAQLLENYHSEQAQTIESQSEEIEVKEDSAGRQSLETTQADPESESMEIEGSIYKWSNSLVLLFLDTYRKSRPLFEKGTQTHKMIWEKIAAELVEKGYNVNGPQCAAKLRSLRKTYKKIKEQNGKSGNGRYTWKFFDIVDKLFSKNEWPKPVAVGDNMRVLVVSSPLDSSDNMDTETLQFSKSLNKTSMKRLLAPRLQQKEEYEKNKKKRFQDREEAENRRWQKREEAEAKRFREREEAKNKRFQERLAAEEKRFQQEEEAKQKRHNELLELHKKRLSIAERLLIADQRRLTIDEMLVNVLNNLSENLKN